MVFFGDGAVQAGHFAETVNLASLWELPLIFVCENNGMAEFTTRARSTPRWTSVCDVVAPYGFDRQVVEGADVARDLDARSATTWTRPDGAPGRSCWSARPTAAAATTRAIRWRAATRSTTPSGPSSTRSHSWRPWPRERDWIDEEDAQALTAAADAEVDRAIAFGRASEPLTPAEAAELVYAP